MRWFLSACISMLKFIKIDWVVAHSVYSRLFVLFFFLNLYSPLNNAYVFNMRIYICRHMCTCGRVCIHKLRISTTTWHFLWHMGCLTITFYCYFPFASLHLPNVPRTGSPHIRHVGLGDDLTEIMSLLEADDSGINLNGPSIDRCKYCHFIHFWKILPLLLF